MSAQAQDVSQVAGVTKPARGKPKTKEKGRQRAVCVRKTEAICSKICNRIADGEALISICKEDGFPEAKTFFRWLEADGELRHSYARARELQCDTLAEQVLGMKARTGEEAQIVKVELDKLKWFASKVYPKKYGERPGDIHVTTAVGVTLPEQERLLLIERQRSAEALPDRGQEP